MPSFDPSSAVPMPSPLPVLCLMGPTASGKTRVALALGLHLPIEIVSVDSVLVYRGLDIGSAKPTAEEQRGVPHHLIDCCDPTEAYSAAQFCIAAHSAVRAIHAAHRIPVLVGGTPLYFKAFIEGLSRLPTADPLLRQQLSREAEEGGIQRLHDRLAKCDPAAAQRLHPNDRHRIIRALEIVQRSGQTLATLQSRREPLGSYPGLDQYLLAPPDRRLLDPDIEARFQVILSQGFEQEVLALRALPGMSSRLPAMRSVGYRQMWAYLSGEIDYSAMKAQAVVATQRLAKRQMTWFRQAFTSCAWFDSREPARLVEALCRRYEAVVRKRFA